MQLNRITSDFSCLDVSSPEVVCFAQLGLENLPLEVVQKIFEKNTSAAWKSMSVSRQLRGAALNYFRGAEKDQKELNNDLASWTEVLRESKPRIAQEISLLAQKNLPANEKVEKTVRILSSACCELHGSSFKETAYPRKAWVDWVDLYRQWESQKNSVELLKEMLQAGFMEPVLSYLKAASPEDRAFALHYLVKQRKDLDTAFKVAQEGGDLEKEAIASQLVLRGDYSRALSLSRARMLCSSVVSSLLKGGDLMAALRFMKSLRAGQLAPSLPLKRQLLSAFKEALKEEGGETKLEQFCDAMPDFHITKVLRKILTKAKENGILFEERFYAISRDAISGDSTTETVSSIFEALAVLPLPKKVGASAPSETLVLREEAFKKYGRKLLAYDFGAISEEERLRFQERKRIVFLQDLKVSS